MGARIIMLNQTYGRLTVIREYPGRKCVCRCICGDVSTYERSNVASGHTQSCGCLQRERAAEANTKHGHGNRRKGLTKTYHSWIGIRQRCQNPNWHAYHRYGGRGIHVCERWQCFENFLDDMGERPEGCEIDRIDRDGHYEPGNCRWISHQENCAERGGLKSTNTEEKFLASFGINTQVTK